MDVNFTSLEDVVTSLSYQSAMVPLKVSLENYLEELKNGTEILVGQAVFKLWIKQCENFVLINNSRTYDLHRRKYLKKKKKKKKPFAHTYVGKIVEDKRTIMSGRTFKMNQMRQVRFVKNQYYLFTNAFVK